MTVKELVGMSESHSPTLPRALQPISDASRVGDDSFGDPASGSFTPTRSSIVPVTTSTPPMPAKLIAHPLLRSANPHVPNTSVLGGVDEDLPPQTFQRSHHDSYTKMTDAASDGSLADIEDSPEVTSDVTSRNEQETIGRRSWSRTKQASNPPPIYEYEMETLPRRNERLIDSSHLSVRHRYQSNSYREDSASVASAATRVPKHHILVSHSPVAASEVFARNAASLVLPHVDHHISSLSAPSFPSIRHIQRDTKITMFPPMNRLAALKGRTLEDLENNSTVRPAWRNRNSILSTLVAAVLGLTGSSALAAFYTLHGLFDTLQIFALVLNTIGSPKSATGEWRRLFLGTIPNILALNFASTTMQSLILLIIFMVLSAVLLYFFRRATSLCCRLGTPEGLQQPNYLESGWGVMIVSLILTVIYLPLSTLALHVLVWSDDLWVVPNPYINATTSPPSIPPLGPPNEFRDPLDFCWTTTVKRNEVNFAPVIIIIALVCLVGLTLWFPLHLRHVTQIVSPKVDPYTELGTRRSNSDMDREYQRLLARDRNPLSFLYGGFRRGWATYESTYLFAKLAALALVAIINPDNCLFRSLSPTRVAVARQILLLLAMLSFFLLQCFLAPFLDPVNNASEWTSRANYVLTSALSLGVALNIPGKNALNGVVLYVIYILTYGLSLYFAIINMSIMRRLVKRLARRIDFSIDIFSPRLDLTPSSPHTKRRIWQEAITTLFLTSPDCGIPKKQPMDFAQARDSEYPPYLLGFTGTPGERHVENLKILREVGSVAYSQGLALVSGPSFAWFQSLEDTIQHQFVGPDCYWKSLNEPAIPGCTSFFGNAWYIPFPPTVVIRYDDGPLAVIREVPDLEEYVKQNSSHEIQRRREIRMALKALDGQIVTWPYEHVHVVGSPISCCRGRRYRAQTSVHYRSCIFSIKRHGQLLYEGLNLGSGFDVELAYAKKVRVGGSVIGLNNDYDLTTPLARFLALNEDLITGPLSFIEKVLRRYRDHQRQECRRKADSLSYRFLSFVYDRPRDPKGLAESSIEHERDLRVRQLMVGNEAVFETSYERLSVVSKSDLSTWWYIFWDDLWRRNHDTISALQKHAPDFDPHYPTSIAYHPLPRPALEAFLSQRGLLHTKPRWSDFFHAGFLNKMYLRMNDIVFHGSKDADIIHLGDDSSEADMEDIDIQTQARASSLGTGGGTDHDDASIRARPQYRWEGILDDPLRTRKRSRRHLLGKLGVWFGVTPLWRSGTPSRGLALDVRLENGQYILLSDEEVHATGVSKDRAISLSSL